MIDRQELIDAAPRALVRTELPGLGARSEGKVRDAYALGAGRRLLVCTDRFSAFDRVLGAIPWRGQVLNRLSAWWFEQTGDLVPGHLLELPHANAMLCREAAVIPVEVIVRGYLTGVTSTSLWTLYNQGVERPYGLALPPGLAKNARLPEPVITPTTKAAAGAHDERLTEAEVVALGLCSAERWRQVRETALRLFDRGQALAARAGLVLVDTKYEFGLVDDELVLIDEIHTPDSSRFWDAAEAADAIAAGREPRGFSKEFLRLWLSERGYGGDGPPPALPAELLAQAAERYIEVFERLTGAAFVPDPATSPVELALALGRLAAPPPLVPIIMGSRSDLAHGEQIQRALRRFGVASEIRVASAHKAPLYLLELLERYERDPAPKVYITVAGRSNALSALVDTQVHAPVIAAPPYSDRFGGADIFSSLRMPSGVAPAVVADPEGAALVAAKILGVHDASLRDHVARHQRAMARTIIGDDEALAAARAAAEVGGA
jgi:phosphoribosylaminoimidazole-succinocarboxamide synthase